MAGANFRAHTYGRAIGDELINAIDDTTADQLTPPTGARVALVSVSGAEPISWRVAGADPTPTTGHPLFTGGYIEVFRDDMSTFRAVCRTAAATTDIFVTYYEE